MEQPHIGKDGKAKLKNHIFKIPNSEGRGKEGINSIVMSPVNPHTITKKGRTCTSCHQSIPEGNLAVSAMTQGVKIDRKIHGDILNKVLNIGAWTQVLLPFIIGGLLVWFLIRRKRRS